MSSSLHAVLAGRPVIGVPGRMLWVLALSLFLCSCGAPMQRSPEVPAEQIEVLLERQQEAEALFQDALRAEGQPEEQKKLYLRALELDPSHGRAHNNLGLIYLEQENYGEAIRSLREAAKRLPANPVPRFNLGYAYELIGRLESAQEQYGAAANIAPEEPDYLESLARVHIKRGERLDKAEELLEKALRVETRPKHVEWIRAQLDGLDRNIIP